MFFLMSVAPEEKELDFSQLAACPGCGAYGRWRVFRICQLLSLFFIPCFRWGRRYVVQTSCCGRRYALDDELGRRIERGERVELRPEDLRPLAGGMGGVRRCARCGYGTMEDFAYCPKCGNRLD